MTNVQQKLKTRMMENDIGTFALAKKANVPESSIKNIIYGKSKKPSLGLIKALAHELNCNVTDIISDKDPRYSQVVRDSHILQQENSVWSPDLQIKVMQAVSKIAEEENIVLSKKDALNIIEEGYNYAAVNGESEVDAKFIRYLIKTYGDK